MCWHNVLQYYHNLSVIYVVMFTFFHSYIVFVLQPHFEKKYPRELIKYLYIVMNSVKSNGP